MATGFPPTHAGRPWYRPRYYYLSLGHGWRAWPRCWASRRKRRNTARSRIPERDREKRFYHADSHLYARHANRQTPCRLAFGSRPAPSAAACAATWPNGHRVLQEHAPGHRHLGPSICCRSYRRRAGPTWRTTGHADHLSELGIMIEKGRTHAVELWQESRGPSMTRTTTPCSASVGAWFYTSLAGIHVDARTPAMERIRIQPKCARPALRLGRDRHVRGRVGDIVGSRRPDTRHLEVTIPPGQQRLRSTCRCSATPAPRWKKAATAVWKERAFVAGVPGVRARARTGRRADEGWPELRCRWASGPLFFVFCRGPDGIFDQN